MGKFCECTQGGANLGQANCDAVLASVDKMLFKARLNADGSIPAIDFSGAAGSFDAPFWATHLQATPLANRYLVGAGVDDYEFEMNDREVVETANAVEYKVRDGHIQVTYNVFGAVGASISLYNRYKQLECGNWGINPIDDKGQLAGVLDGTDMRLIPINSVQVKYGAQQNTGQVAHVMITFRIPHTFDWGSVRLFQPNVSAGDLNLSEIMPIVPLNLSGIAATDSSADVDVTVFQEATQISSGNGQAGIPMVGLIPSNFVVTRNGSPVVVSSVTETADGVYEITLATSNTTGDVLTVQVVAQGFESSVSTITV
jgi:hypothetical protein